MWQIFSVFRDDVEDMPDRLSFAHIPSVGQFGCTSDEDTDDLRLSLRSVFDEGQQVVGAVEADEEGTVDGYLIHAGVSCAGQTPQASV